METKKRTARAVVERLSSASAETRTAALAELRLISKHDPESRPLIAAAGALPCLVDSLYTTTGGGGDQENAAAALLNLSISSRALLLSTPGLLDGISDLLLRHRHPTSPPPAAAVQSAAATLHSLLLSEAHRGVIGAKRDIVFALIDIVRHRESPARSVKDALKALFGLALWAGNRAAMVEMGAVGAALGAVVNSGRGGRGGVREGGRGGGVGGLGGPQRRGVGGGRVRENAVAGLLNLARWGGAAAKEEVRRACLEGGGEGVLEGLMEVAVSGTGKGRGKARDLLGVLNNDVSGDGNQQDDATLGNLRFDHHLLHNLHHHHDCDVVSS
ncbi:hypothetical protein Sjap_002125 [Stephania japonica]|uniref:Uncharacterized protein n=1 Tax=Stephania japonica TaxID=461633 RepID=A0AAP0PTW1_9MAGN